MLESAIYVFVVLIATLVILVCFIGIILSVSFQKKKNKKYKECIDTINKNNIDTISPKDGLTKEEIMNIIDVDVDEFMKTLYNTFLDFQHKLNGNDRSLENLLTGFIKEYYINRIDFFNQKGFNEVVDNINLIGYSILELNPNETKFRIAINCNSYKLLNNSLKEQFKSLEQILIITYRNINNKWLINKIEKVYEKNLSD